jgi:hypothetical protein
MNGIIVKAGIGLAVLPALGCLQGCFEWQRAWGRNDPGILGCKDKMPEPSEITQPPAGLKRAPPGGRAQQASVGDEKGAGFIFRDPRYRQATFSRRYTEKINPVPFSEYCYPHD